MRILCLNYEYPPLGGGGAAMCQGLSQALARDGHQVDVVTSGMGDLATTEEREGLRIFRVSCWRRYRHYTTVAELFSQVVPAYRKALELVRRQPYDINHTHFVVPSGLVASLLRRRTGLPYVLTAHGSDVPGYNPDRFAVAHRLIRPAWLRILKGASAVTVPSRFLQALLRDRSGMDSLVIPHGIEPLPARGAPRRRRVLAVTRMFERKGIQYLIPALDALPPGWEAWIVGDGPYLPALKRLAREARIPVRFLGYVQGPELTEIYRSAEVFVFPSIQENFPVVLLEAMAAGCAVITTMAAGCAEVVGEAAIQVEPGSIETLRGALAPLLRDEEAIARLGQASVRRVQRFTWSRIADDYLDLFGQHALSASGRAP